MEKFGDYLHELLQDDQAAKSYINTALEEFLVDHDKKLFLAALKDVVNARGGISKIASKTHLNRQHLYKMLSDEGNPSFDNVGLLLAALGLKFVVVNSHL